MQLCFRAIVAVRAGSVGVPSGSHCCFFTPCECNKISRAWRDVFFIAGMDAPLVQCCPNKKITNGYNVHIIRYLSMYNMRGGFTFVFFYVHLCL